jgi:hypothetical protein
MTQTHQLHAPTAADGCPCRSPLGLDWKRAAILRALILGQVAALILMTETPARAYVDPGSSLLTFQMVGASLAGTFFFLRHKLRQLFTRNSDNLPVDRTSDRLDVLKEKERTTS